MVNLNQKSFLLGFLFCALLVGCSGVTIRYYSMDGVRYAEGVLKGPEPKYNRAFSDCEPDAVYKHGKCVVMFQNEFDGWKKDYLTCKSDLNTCQRNSGGGG